MRRAAVGGDARIGSKIGHAIAEIDALGAELPVVGSLSTRTVLTPGGTYAAREARAAR